MMNRDKFLVSIVAFGFLMLGCNLAADAQRRSGKEFRTWAIHSSAFLSLREGGKSFSLNDKGVLEKRSKNSETKETVKAADLQQIVKLLRELDLTRTKTKTVKGKGIYDWPYWGFTIEINGKSFLMEGFFFDDANLRVLTKKQTQTFVTLKEKLNEIGTIQKTGSARDWEISFGSASGRYLQNVVSQTINSKGRITYLDARNGTPVAGEISQRQVAEIAVLLDRLSLRVAEKIPSKEFNKCIVSPHMPNTFFSLKKNNKEYSLSHCNDFDGKGYQYTLNLSARQKAIYKNLRVKLESLFDDKIKASKGVISHDEKEAN